MKIEAGGLLYVRVVEVFLYQFRSLLGRGCEERLALIHRELEGALLGVARLMEESLAHEMNKLECVV